MHSNEGEHAESRSDRPPTAGMTGKVIKGTVWTLIGQVAPLLVSFVTTAFVIRILGVESYGVLILVGLIPSYLVFADFGMGMGSTKFGSEAYAEGSPEREAQVVRTAALITLSTSLPFALLLAFSSTWLLQLLNVPPDLQGEAVIALRIAAATFVINFLNMVFNTPQLTRLRMDLNTVVSAVPRILGAIATPFVIYYGGGIVGAVSVLLAASIVTLLANIYVSRGLLPELIGSSLDRTMIPPMLKFGSALVLASIAAVFLLNIEKLILTRLTSVETLAHYSVAFTVANMVTIFTAAMAQSLVPAFSQLSQPEKSEQLTNLYSRSLKINVFGLLPSLVMLAVVAKPFFTLWAGEEFGRESPLPFYVLLVGLFFNLNAYIPWALILSQGRTDIFAKLYWIELFPYIAITAYLTYQFGAVGAAAAWSARVIAESFVFVTYAKRVAGVHFGFLNYAGTFALGCVVLLPSLLFALYVESLSLWLLFIIPTSFFAYAVLVWKTVIEPEEKGWVTDRVGYIYNRIFRFV